jgi:DNA polymerase V
MTTVSQNEALQAIGLTDLWGVADRLAARLGELGITTPLQLREADARLIRQRLGVVAERIVLELQGVPCMELEHVAPTKKSIIASRSFGRPVVMRNELEEAVATYAARAAEKMRRQNLCTAHVVVFIQTNRFKPREPQYFAQQAIHLTSDTADTSRLITAAQWALGRIWKAGFSYKKAGVMLLDLSHRDQAQPGLLVPADSDRAVATMAALDAINRRFGHDTLSYAASGSKRAWKLRSEFMSGRYTTDWDELLKVG